VRSDQRNTVTWYELAHDRLVAPVHNDNAAWFLANLSPLQRQAKLWQEQSRPDSLLLRGADLAAEEDRLADRPSQLSPVETDFLAACRGSSARQWWKRAAIAGLVALAALSGFGFLRATQSSQIAAARSLASAALLFKDTQTDLASLLAIEAYNRDASYYTRDALLLTAQANPRLMGYVPLPSRDVLPQLDRTGTFLLTLAEDKVDFWNPLTRAKVRELSIPGLVAADLSRDLATLAVAACDEADSCGVTLLDLTRNPPASTPLPGRFQELAALTLSPDDSLLAAAGTSPSLRVWDLKTAKELTNWHPPQSTVRALWFAADGKALYTLNGGYDAYEVPSGRALPSPKAELSFSIDPNTHRVIQVGDATLTIMDGSTPDLTFQLPDTDLESPAIAPSGSSYQLLDSGDQYGITAWSDANKFEWLRSGAGKVVYTAGLAANRTPIAADSNGGVWNLGPDYLPTEVREPLIGDPVGDLSFSSAGPWLVAGVDSGAPEVWDVAKRALLRRLGPAKTPGDAIAFAPDGRTVAIAPDPGIPFEGSGNGNPTVVRSRYAGKIAIQFWDALTGAVVRPPLLGSAAPVDSLAFASGSRMAAGEADGVIRLWDLSQSPPQAQVIDDPHDPRALGANVAFSRDGRLLAAANTASNILLDTAVAKSRSQAAHRLGFLSSVSFHPDGSRVAFTAEIVLTERPATIFNGPKSPDSTIVATRFTADGAVLVSADANGALQLWDAATAQPIGAPLLPQYVSGLTGNLDVSRIAVSPDGQYLAAGGQGGLWVLHISPASWIDRNCSRANRNLTKAEWAQYVGSEPYRKTCPNLPEGLAK
jgi:WD40 repeat protein